SSVHGSLWPHVAPMLSTARPAVEESARQPVVLVVEDEILIRSSVAEYLRMAGYKVVEAAKAAEAVAGFASGTGIDLVFSDIEMPGPMNGVGLAHWVSYNWPGIRVILTSGVRRAAEAREIAAFLSKPYRLAEAALRVRSLLGGPAQGKA